MDLLREGRVGPARRLVFGCVLEAQANLAVADVDPVTVDSGDRQPEQFGVEPRQAVWVAAIEHPCGKLADHRGLLPPPLARFPKPPRPARPPTLHPPRPPHPPNTS